MIEQFLEKFFSPSALTQTIKVCALRRKRRRPSWRIRRRILSNATSTENAEICFGNYKVRSPRIKTNPSKIVEDVMSWIRRIRTYAICVAKRATRFFIYPKMKSIKTGKRKKRQRTLCEKISHILNFGTPFSKLMVSSFYGTGGDADDRETIRGAQAALVLLFSLPLFWYDLSSHNITNRFFKYLGVWGRAPP